MRSASYAAWPGRHPSAGRDAVRGGLVDQAQPALRAGVHPVALASSGRLDRRGLEPGAGRIPRRPADRQPGPDGPPVQHLQDRPQRVLARPRIPGSRPGQGDARCGPGPCLRRPRRRSRGDRSVPRQPGLGRRQPSRWATSRTASARSHRKAWLGRPSASGSPAKAGWRGPGRPSPSKGSESCRDMFEA